MRTSAPETYFAAGSDQPLDGDFFIGSADWMYRILSSRVEVVGPVTARSARERLWEILDITLRDQRQAWEMQPDGSYQQLRSPSQGDSTAMLGTQQTLIDDCALIDMERTAAELQVARSGDRDPICAPQAAGVLRNI